LAFSHKLAVIGLIIAVAFLGSKAFQRLGIPQVVGFIVMGVILGTSFLSVVPKELVDELTFISEIALGLIGFDIGSHLLVRDLRKLGRSIFLFYCLRPLGHLPSSLPVSMLSPVSGTLHSSSAPFRLPLTQPPRWTCWLSTTPKDR
jgi:hypothetical protein